MGETRESQRGREERLTGGEVLKSSEAECELEGVRGGGMGMNWW